MLKYAFKRPITFRYPEEKRKLPTRSRGRQYLTKWNDGLERCVGCELCAIVCPSQAIYVKPAANEPETSIPMANVMPLIFKLICCVVFIAAIVRRPAPLVRSS